MLLYQYIHRAQSYTNRIKVAQFCVPLLSRRVRSVQPWKRYINLAPLKLYRLDLRLELRKDNLRPTLGK